MPTLKPRLSARDRRSGKGRWYLTETLACPLCGRETVYRTRQDPPAPPLEDRYRYMDAPPCSEHFL